MFGLFAVLTYLHVAVAVFVMLGWAIYERRLPLLLQKRILVLLGFAAGIVGPWIVFQWWWDPIHRAAALHLGDYPFWKIDSWKFYAGLMPQLVTMPLLLAALASLGLGFKKTRWRVEVLFPAIWFGVCYTWFSVLSVKESRHVLLLIPPIVFLGAIGIVGYLEWLAEWLGRKSYRAILPVLLFVVATHLWMASSVYVSRVSGFQEIVGFLRTTAPNQRVFYDGAYNGVFSFYLRAVDSEFTNSVMLGSKLLYATSIEARWGKVEFASSPGDVIERLQRKCGCRWLVVEREIWGLEGIQAVRHLRHALTRSEFRLVRSFPVEADGVKNVDLYEYRGPLSAPSHVELPFPVLGDGTEFTVDLNRP
jgi:hypothetical protein